MTQPRSCAVSFVLRAALLAILIVAAVPALSFGPTGLARAGDAGSGAFTAAASPPPFPEPFPGPEADADDLGLGIGPVYSGDEALFTIFYNATSYGEMHPCPT